jgi:hypothetical protein
MVAAWRYALLLSFALVACSGSNEAVGAGPVVDDVGGVVKIRSRELDRGQKGEKSRIDELRVIVSFHDPDGDTIEQYSFVPLGSAPVWRDFPSSAKKSEGDQVELVAETDDLPAGPHSFDLMLRDERGREGPRHRVAFTLAQ